MIIEISVGVGTVTSITVWASCLPPHTILKSTRQFLRLNMLKMTYLWDNTNETSSQGLLHFSNWAAENHQKNEVEHESFLFALAKGFPSTLAGKRFTINRIGKWPRGSNRSDWLKILFL